LSTLKPEVVRLQIHTEIQRSHDNMISLFRQIMFEISQCRNQLIWTDDCSLFLWLCRSFSSDRIQFLDNQKSV